MGSERRDLTFLETDLTTAAGVTVNTITVPVGETWRIIHAMGYHNDAVARSVYWALIVRGVTKQVCDPGVASASGVESQLYTVVPVKESFILHEGDALSFIASALTAGNVLYHQILYERRSGEVV